MKRLLGAVAVALALWGCVPPEPIYPPPPPATLIDSCFIASSKQILLVFQLTALGNYRMHVYGPPPVDDAPRVNVTGVQTWATYGLPVELQFEVLPGVWRRVGFAPYASPGYFCP